MGNYQQINLEKGMYQTGGKSFGQILEELDPSSAYEGTRLAKMDAFTRQLCRFGIRLSGTGSSRVDKFFEHRQAAVLFPEYVTRAVNAGLSQGNLLSRLVACTTCIDGLDYRTIATKVKDPDKVVKEGETIPVTSIATQDGLVKLNKRGRLLEASYESIRFQRLDLFTVTLKQIGAAIGRAQLEDAIGVLLAGDGNANSAPVVSSAAAGKLTYDDLLKFWGEFEEHELNTLVVNGATMMTMAQIAEFKNPQTGINFAGAGTLSTPLGADLLKSKFVPGKKIIGLDKNAALEKICAFSDGVQLETDKLIDRQLERTTITSTTGYAKIFPEATKVLSFA